MPTKEDILKQAYEKVFRSQKYKDSVNRKMNQSYILPAMDAYAEKIAVLMIMDITDCSKKRALELWHVFKESHPNL